MSDVYSHVKAFVAAFALVLAMVIALPTTPVRADAFPTLILAGSQSGGPGAAVSYKYTWDAADCKKDSAPADPAKLTIVLYWDDAATTPIGFQPVTYKPVKSGDQGECDGTVSGTVPANATAGDHFPSAALKEPSSNGNKIVPNSDTGKVLPGQQFTVVLPPTPTPAPTPTPTPSDTPLPTDTPTPDTSTPASTPTPSSAGTFPITASNTGGSSLKGVLIAGVVVILLIAAITAAVLAARRRRARRAADDPFEFLR